MPGTLVAIGSNGPRTSAGGSGLGSQGSIWLGAPTRKREVDVRAFFFFAEGRAAFWARNLGSVRPRAAMAPACRKSRRVRPSQNETERLASSRSMVETPAPAEGWVRGGTPSGYHDRKYRRATIWSTTKGFF